jgi:hypothetical protein
LYVDWTGSCDTEQAGWKFKGYMQDTGTDSMEFRLSEHIVEARHGYSEMQKCTDVLIRKLPVTVDSIICFVD